MITARFARLSSTLLVFVAASCSFSLSAAININGGSNGGSGVSYRWLHLPFLGETNKHPHPIPVQSFNEQRRELSYYLMAYDDDSGLVKDDDDSRFSHLCQAHKMQFSGDLIAFYLLVHKEAHQRNIATDWQQHAPLSINNKPLPELPNELANSLRSGHYAFGDKTGNEADDKSNNQEDTNKLPHPYLVASATYTEDTLEEFDDDGKFNPFSKVPLRINRPDKQRVVDHNNPDKPNFLYLTRAWLANDSKAQAKANLVELNVNSGLTVNPLTGGTLILPTLVKQQVTPLVRGATAINTLDNDQPPLIANALVQSSMYVRCKMVNSSK